MIFVGEHEQQVGVGGQIELAHAEPAQRDDHELLARPVRLSRGRMSHADLFDGHAVGCGDGGVGQIRGNLQSVENRHAKAQAGGLNAKHFAAEEAPQGGNVFQREGRVGIGILLAGWQLAQLFH